MLSSSREQQVSRWPWTLITASTPAPVQSRSGQAHLAGDHEQGEEQDEGALGDGDPLGLLQGEQDGSVQAGLGGAGGDHEDAWLVDLFKSILCGHFYLFILTPRC